MKKNTLNLGLRFGITLILTVLNAALFAGPRPTHTFSTSAFERQREAMVIQEYHYLFEGGLGSMQVARRVLERKPRAGFVKRGVQNPENVAQHSVNLARAAFSFAPALGIQGRDLITYVRTALIHDLAEWAAPDYTPGEVSKNFKMDKEKRAMDKLESLELDKQGDVDVSIINELTYIRALWEQYNEAPDSNYKILKQLNKMDSFIKATHYLAARNGNRKKLLEFYDWIEQDAKIENPDLISIIKILKANFNSLASPNKNVHGWYFRELSSRNLKK